MAMRVRSSLGNAAASVLLLLSWAGCLANAQEITSFQLIDVTTKSSIMELTEGLKVDLQALGYTTGPNFNVEATTADGAAVVASVRFGLDAKPTFRTENAFPYALCGDAGGLYYNCPALNVGNHTLTATAFAGKMASGVAGSPYTINFSIVESSASTTVDATLTIAPVSAAALTTAPISASPITTAPISASPITTAPISASPITTAPISASPVTLSPGFTEVAPTSPIVSPPASPSNVPPGSPKALDSTAAPVHVANLLRLEVRDATTYALVEKLDGGEVLDLNELNVPSFNILARPQYGSGVINSVVFTYNGDFMSVRNVPNLLWMCDNACSLGAGEVTLSATAFSGPNGTGIPGETQTVTFTHASPTSSPTNVSIDVPSQSPTDTPTSSPNTAPSLPSQSPTNKPNALLTDTPSDVPSQSPTDKPNALLTDTPSDVPSQSPTDKPNALLTDTPSDVPSQSPTDKPNALLTNTPSDVPSQSPTDKPNALMTNTSHDVPSRSPTDKPNALASDVPSGSPIGVSGFQDILINCGAGVYYDITGRKWSEDIHFEGGKTFNSGFQNVTATLNDHLYFSERSGEFSYEIPVPPGNFEIKLHFAEVFFSEPGKRVFDMFVEGEFFKDLDLIVIGGKFSAFTIEVAKVVDDGFVSIKGIKKVNHPKISAIEIILQEVHTAHAVAQGPYVVVDKDGDGFGVVSVDASPSHTHGLGMVLTDFIWKEGTKLVGSGEIIDFTLPVGEHSISLTVIDSSGNDSTEVTTITVLPSGYPDIEKISPDSGSISGGYEVTISGSGFTKASDIVVHFGLTALTGGSIQVLDENTIKLNAPLESVAVPVQVYVESIPLAVSSNSKAFIYETAIPIVWKEQLIADFSSVATATFGPDGKLYAATTEGQIAKITLDEDFNLVDAVVAKVAPDCAILGVAFDPLTTADEVDPPIYFAASDLFHKEWMSSSGKAINGKIQRASGANLDIIEDIVTGLPIADHDHAINSIVFGDNGELYMQIGSNTNGGLPGQLTGSQLQKENYFSAATVVAYLSDPEFEANIQYDKEDDGIPITKGVEVFASGLRNPFGICLHSNGYLYGTDNGPNLGYGDMKTGCGETDFIPDVETEDRIHVILEDHYYGHPNPIRAAADADERQCKYRFIDEPSDAQYTAPIVIAPSSTGAIIEFESDHFGGQLRHNLIYCKYTSKLHRVILRPDGLGVIAQSDPPLGLVGKKGLGVTQAPDGSLVQVQYSINQLWVYIPDEEVSEVKINSVFPRRGHLGGGSTFAVYGANLQKSGVETAVTVGGSACPLVSITPTKIKCTLPGGSGTVDVTVAVGGESYTFNKGYRFIKGGQ